MRRGEARLGALALLAGVTIAAFANALAAASRLAQTSDSANAFVVGHAIAGGNVLLSGWHFPLDDYYFTDFLPYAIAEWLLGPRPTLLVLVPALTYALFVLAALLACQDTERPFARNLTSCAALALLLAAPPWIGQWNPVLLSDMHMATALDAFVALALCANVADARRTPWFTAALLPVVACASMASDPFALVFAFGPALAVLLAEAVMRPERRGVRLGLTLLAAGTVAGVILPFAIAYSGGFTIEDDVLTRPIAPLLLGRNLIAVATGTFALFGMTVHGTGMGLREFLLLALRGIGLVIAAAAVLRVLRYFFARDRIVLFDRMLCAGILTVLAACMLSAQFAKGITPQNLWAAGPPMRFLVPVWLFAAVLAGRQAPELLSALPAAWARSALASGAAILVFGAFWLSGLEERPPWIAGNPPAVTAAWLRRHGLFQGVGEYWSANLVTAMSGNAVEIRSIVPQSGRFVPYIWVEDARWYGKSPQFVIWHDGNQTGVTMGQVRRTYAVCRLASAAGFRVAVLKGRACIAPVPPSAPLQRS